MVTFGNFTSHDSELFPTIEEYRIIVSKNTNHQVKISRAIDDFC